MLVKERGGSVTGRLDTFLADWQNHCLSTKLTPLTSSRGFQVKPGSIKFPRSVRNVRGSDLTSSVKHNLGSKDTHRTLSLHYPIYTSMYDDTLFRFPAFPFRQFGSLNVFGEMIGC